MDHCSSPARSLLMGPASGTEAMPLLCAGGALTTCPRPQVCWHLHERAPRPAPCAQYSAALPRVSLVSLACVAALMAPRARRSAPPPTPTPHRGSSARCNDAPQANPFLPAGPQPGHHSSLPQPGSRLSCSFLHSRPGLASEAGHPRRGVAARGLAPPAGSCRERPVRGAILRPMLPPGGASARCGSQAAARRGSD